MLSPASASTAPSRSPKPARKEAPNNSPVPVSAVRGGRTAVGPAPPDHGRTAAIGGEVQQPAVVLRRAVTPKARLAGGVKTKALTRRRSRNNSESEDSMLGSTTSPATKSPAPTPLSPRALEEVFAVDMVHPDPQPVPSPPLPVPEAVATPVAYALKQANLSHKQATRALNDGGKDVVFADSNTAGCSHFHDVCSGTWTCSLRIASVHH
jgi:hypothetical protein